MNKLITCLLATLTYITLATTADARFIQPDWWDPTEPGVGTNRYTYSGNDPVNKSDPSGNFWDWLAADQEERDATYEKNIETEKQLIRDLQKDENAPGHDIRVLEHLQEIERLEGRKGKTWKQLAAQDLPLVFESAGAGTAAVAARAATTKTLAATTETTLAKEVAEASASKVALREAAERLGVDLGEIAVENGTASITIKTSEFLKRDDITQLADHLKNLGAEKVKVNSGLIANDDLMRAMNFLADRGIPFNGGKVTRGNAPGNDFIIFFDF